jgi:hypothetical protein
MNIITETIPAVFSPDTAFSIPLQAINGEPEQASESVMPYRYALPAEVKFTWQAIPESALHD